MTNQECNFLHMITESFQVIFNLKNPNIFACRYIASRYHRNSISLSSEPVLCTSVTALLQQSLISYREKFWG